MRLRSIFGLAGWGHAALSGGVVVIVTGVLLAATWSTGGALAKAGQATPGVRATPEEPPARGQPSHAVELTPSPRNASYSIDARLDPATRTITGRQVLTWRNISNISTDELRFHLYYNAWKNTRSTWMRERLLGRGGGLASRPQEDWSWIDVTAIRLIGAGAAPPIGLTGRMRFIAPDDGNPDDQTVLSVGLPLPVMPDETINLEIQWTARVPRTFARTGAIGDYFFIAQWFPKIGVLEDTGWNCRQFHTATEFYADYGVYDVRLTVPSGWIVGATGRETSRRDNGDGSTTHAYYQEDVHDFAWTTSPNYLEFLERFEHAELPGVDMRLLLQPEHAGQERRHFEATRAALRYYGEWFGPYPYGHLTVVDPAWQSGAGGMEYPTLFTAGTRWRAPDEGTTPESVTVHEAGHQFWYGLVGNNEVEHAWLDEGFNTFATARVLDEAFTPRYRIVRLFGGFVPHVEHAVRWSREREGDRVSAYRDEGRMDDQATPAWRYWPGSASTISYNKTALWLHTLERYLGWPVLQQALATFFERWTFAHPRPDDFFRTLGEVSGQDLRWFFDQVYRDSVMFDYGVAMLTTRPTGGRGFFGDEQGAAFTEDSDRRALFETTLVVRRYGEGRFPVDVAVEFADGEIAKESWDGRDRWRAFTFQRPARATRAFVDPERVLMLDVNRTNNSLTLAPRAGEAASKWTARWIVWLQDVLLTYLFLV